MWIKINLGFNYNKNSYAITESLFPEKEYELSVRSDKYVLFFKVDWEDIDKRNFIDYQPRISFHYIAKVRGPSGIDGVLFEDWLGLMSRLGRSIQRYISLAI